MKSEPVLSVSAWRELGLASYQQLKQLSAGKSCYVNKKGNVLLSNPFRFLDHIGYYSGLEIATNMATNAT